MTSSFLGRRSRRTQRLPHRFAPKDTQNQPGRAKHSSMPRNSSRSGVHQNVAAHPLFGADDVVRSADSGSTWSTSAGRRSVVSFDLRTEFRLHVGPCSSSIGTFRFRWKIRFKHAQVRPRNGCGPGISPPSPRWKSAISISHVSWSKILPTCDLCHCGPCERIALICKAPSLRRAVLPIGTQTPRDEFQATAPPEPRALSVGSQASAHCNSKENRSHDCTQDFGWIVASACRRFLGSAQQAESGRFRSRTSTPPPG